MKKIKTEFEEMQMLTALNKVESLDIFCMKIYFKQLGIWSLFENTAVRTYITALLLEKDLIHIQYKAKGEITLFITNAGRAVLAQYNAPKQMELPLQ